MTRASARAQMLRLVLVECVETNCSQETKGHMVRAKVPHKAISPFVPSHTLTAVRAVMAILSPSVMPSYGRICHQETTEAWIVGFSTNGRLEFVLKSRY